MTVIVDGKEYNSTDVQDGKATFNFGSFDKELDLKNLEVIYNGTDEYYPSYGHLNLTITKYFTVVSNESVSGKAGETISVDFKVTTNESGVVVNGGHLTVEFDGKEYNSTDVQDGKATFNFGSFDKGLKLDYLVVYYNGTLEFSKSNGYLNLTIIKPEVIVSDVLLMVVI